MKQSVQQQHKVAICNSLVSQLSNMAHRPRGTSPVSVLNAPRTTTTTESTATKQQLTAPLSPPTLEQQVAALIGPGPVARYGPYCPSTAATASIQSATRLVPDLRWNAVVPLPSSDDESDNVIYICPARFKGRGLPLHLMRYAAQCLMERYTAKQVPLTILMNLKDWKMTARCNVQEWVTCFCELPRLLSVHHVLLVNAQTSPDFDKLLENVQQAISLPAWVHCCNSEDELQTKYGLKAENLPTDLKIGKLPMYQLVEDFIHYRQMLEGLLERQKRPTVQPLSSASAHGGSSSDRHLYHSRVAIAKRTNKDGLSSSSLHADIATVKRTHIRPLRKHGSLSKINYIKNPSGGNRMVKTIATGKNKSSYSSSSSSSSSSNSTRAATNSTATKNGSKPRKDGSSSSLQKKRQPVPSTKALVQRATTLRHVPNNKTAIAKTSSSQQIQKRITTRRPFHRTASTSCLPSTHNEPSAAKAVAVIPEVPPPNSSGRPRLTRRTSSVPQLPKRISSV